MELFCSRSDRIRQQRNSLMLRLRNAFIHQDKVKTE
jgi:hypothetical protein